MFHKCVKIPDIWEWEQQKILENFIFQSAA